MWPFGWAGLFVILPNVLLATIIYYFLLSLIKRLELLANLRITSIWVLLCFSVLLFPHFAVEFNVIIFMAALAVYYLFAHKYIARRTIKLQIAHITNQVSLASKSLKSVKYMNGDTNNLPHIVGMLFACIFYLNLERTLQNVSLSSILALAMYIFVMSLLIRQILVLRFPISGLVEKTSRSNFLLIGASEKTTKIDEFQMFLKHRRRLILVEILTQIIIVVSAWILLRNYTLPTTNIPLAFVVIAVSKYFSVHLLIAYRQFVKFFFSYRLTTVDSFEYDDVMKLKDKTDKKDKADAASPEKRTIWQKMRRLLNPTTSIIKFLFFLWLALQAITMLVNSIDAITRIMTFFRNLF